MNLKHEIYQKIVLNPRVAVYSIHTEIWNVIHYNESIYIHYKTVTKGHQLTIFFYLSGSKIVPKWPCQCEPIDLRTFPDTESQNTGPAK